MYCEFIVCTVPRTKVHSLLGQIKSMQKGFFVNYHANQVNVLVDQFFLSVWENSVNQIKILLVYQNKKHFSTHNNKFWTII